jgi:glucose/arabinose dehydrogenase
MIIGPRATGASGANMNALTRGLCGFFLLLAALSFSSTAHAADTVRLEPLLSGLKHPWAMAFSADGQLYFTERVGKLTRFGPERHDMMAIFGVPPPRAQGEAGTLGLALDPDFTDNGLIYICYSSRNAENSAINRLSRFHLVNQRLTEETVLFDNMPGAGHHNGCRVIVSPDGAYLYFSMGDAEKAGMAQTPDYLGGKIFRIALDGAIPGDNPFRGSAVWSFGHRNPQGLRFRPGTDQLWSTEHGPDTQDELNLIEKGANYGWPICRGTDQCTALPDYHPALAEFDHADTVAISDLIFYSGKAHPQWTGNILFVTLKTGRLYRLVLNGDKVVRTDILINGTYGRLRDIAEGPDGTIYISTDNGDDSIMQVVPE